MPEPILYALKEDLDMIATQVNEHNKAYGKLDWIAQKMKKLEEELTCQGEQMRRIELRMDRIEERMDRIEERMDRIEERMDRIEKELTCQREQMRRMDIKLDLICKKLNIKID